MRLPLPVSLLGLSLCFGLAPGLASAQTLVPGPSAAGHDAALAARMDGLGRVQDAVLSRPVGFGLEAFIFDAADRTAVETFAASGSTDFQATTGLHPYQVVDFYEEQGDLGMFGGVQAAGVAWRYVVLRDGGAPAAEVDLARAALLRALEGLHWFTAATGVPGGIARGLMRITPEAGEPPLPGTPPTTTPLFDAMGNPLPAVKQPVWRADGSGALPFLVWFDDTSKDQTDGYILALGAAYDAIAGDPSIDPALSTRLQADAAAIGHRLMTPVDIGGHLLDLVLVDADGRPTTYHDLSAEELAPGTVSTDPRLRNGFNALLGLAIMRTLYHISGDPEIGRFYYEELVGARDYLTSVERTVQFVYAGASTNFSNVNMAFVAAYGLGRYETDPTVQRRLRAVLEDHLYAPGVDRQPRGLAMPFFDFVYAGLREAGGTDAAGAAAIADGTASLTAHLPAPYWDVFVENCTPAELAALSCTTIDGSTITLLSTSGLRGLSAGILPYPIRPPSNFEHRSDPFEVNGGGSLRLNPAGDVVAAYWMGRMLATGGGDANVSPHARAPLPWTPRTTPDGGPRLDAGTGTDAASDAGPPATSPGCGCRAQGAGPLAPAVSALFVVVALRIRRRRA